MKISSVFWGIFLIIFGSFLLMDLTGIYEFDLNLLKYWPVLLVLWGVMLLKIPKEVKMALAGFTGAFLALYLMSLVSGAAFKSWDMDWNWSNEKHGKSAKFENRKANSVLEAEYNDSIKTAFFEFDGGAGKFEIEETTAKLIEVESSHMRPVLDSYIDGGQARVHFFFMEKNISLNNPDNGRYAEIRLNSNPVWDFNMDVGAADFDLDLRPFKIRKFDIDAGAADVEIVLGGMYNDTELNINCGAANVEIKIPRESACKISSGLALASGDFDGFTKRDGYYYTENYESSENKIFIDIDGALTSVEVKRY